MISEWKVNFPRMSLVKLDSILCFPHRTRSVQKGYNSGVEAKSFDTPTRDIVVMTNEVLLCLLSDYCARYEVSRSSQPNMKLLANTPWSVHSKLTIDHMV